jgi:[acyl-carrier-protein] S-malonyltransferase
MVLDPRTAAFLFPGQGSQIVGMGQRLAQVEPDAADVFARADTLLGYSLSTLCWEGPAEDLNDTVHTQPALLVHGCALLAVLRKRRPDLTPSFVAGHSMGEYTALVAAGSLSFEDGLRLVRERGLAMQAAGSANPGSMAAVLGLDVEQADGVCQRVSATSGGIVQVANDNCPGQIVISGDAEALQAAAEALKAAGARKIIRLAVSIAAHSPLMASAQERLNHAIEAADLREPVHPIVGNVEAGVLPSVEAIRRDLSLQLMSRVRWTESVRFMAGRGVTTFLEIGPGSVLTGLVKRIIPSAEAISLDAPEGLGALTG